MSINDIKICTKKHVFTLPGEWDMNCINEEHNWKLLVFCDDYTPNPGVAICTKCASLQGGWIREENSTDDQ